MTVPFSWELPYAWPRKPVLARNVVCTSAAAGQSGRPGDARRRRQRGRCGTGRSDYPDLGRAGVERHRFGRFRHCVGRREVARVECLGPLAGLVDAGVLPRRPGSEAGLELSHGARRGVGLDRTARSVRQTTFRAGSSSRRSATAPRGFSSRRRWPRSGPDRCRSYGHRPDSPKCFFRVVGRRLRGNGSGSQSTRRRWRRSRPRAGRRSIG